MVTVTLPTQQLVTEALKTTCRGEHTSDVGLPDPPAHPPVRVKAQVLNGEMQFTTT